jgi:hypothetical protein
MMFRVKPMPNGHPPVRHTSKTTHHHVSSRQDDWTVFAPTARHGMFDTAPEGTS